MTDALATGAAAEAAIGVIAYLGIAGLLLGLFFTLTLIRYRAMSSHLSPDRGGFPRPRGDWIDDTDSPYGRSVSNSGNPDEARSNGEGNSG